MRRRHIAYWLGVAVVLAGCNGDPRPRTQVMITVEAEALVVELAESVEVVVESGTAGTPWAWQETYRNTFTGGAEGIDWPVVLGMVPAGNDPTRGYEVTARALDATGSEIVRVVVRSGFVAERTLWLRIVLTRTCAQQPEDPSCDLMEVDPATLPEWMTGPRTLDAGSPDAGESDAGAPGDSGLDGGSPDAGPEDAGPPPDCVEPEDCADDDPCTDEACEEGTCVFTPNTAWCDDANACTADDRCGEGICAGTAKICPSGQSCERATGSCVCPSGTVMCGSSCRSLCCPGSTAGTCGACGTRTCNSAGTGYDCLDERPGGCTNPGSDVCSGSGCCGTPVGCCGETQRALCNGDCSWGGCYP